MIGVAQPEHKPQAKPPAAWVGVARWIRPQTLREPVTAVVEHDAIKQGGLATEGITARELFQQNVPCERRSRLREVGEAPPETPTVARGGSRRQSRATADL